MRSTRKRTETATDEEVSPAKKANSISPPVLQPCPLFGQSTPDPPSSQPSLMQCELFGPIKKAVIKISDIQLGTNSQWTIIGRVTFKTRVRQWNNDRGHGQSISFDIFDGSGEIGVTAFNSKVDEVSQMNINGIYEVRGFRAQQAKMMYLRIPGQAMELILSPQSTITPSDADIADIPFYFEDITQIHAKVSGSFVDFVGIIYANDDVMEGIAKDGHEYKFRVLRVTDKTRNMYIVKLWGEAASEFEISQPTTVVIRRARLDEFEETKCLTVKPYTLFLLNSELPEAQDMSSWFEGAKA